MPLDSRYGSALAVVCSNGNTKAIRLLLNAGAEIDLPLRGRYGSALAAASFQGATIEAEAMVLIQLLIQLSPKVDSGCQQSPS